jgi:tape measure domain-containing protein
MPGSGAAGSLWVKLGLSSKQFDTSLKKAENDLKKFGDRLNTLGMRITQGISLPLAAVGGSAIKMAADMETAQVALTTLMGSASAANKQMAQLKQFAASTPFRFTELLSATRRMMAFGFQAKETIPILRNLGNASFALGQGAEGVNNMILALGQMRMKGRAQSEELTRQLGQYVGAWQYLADYLTKGDVQKAMNMVEKRMIDGETAVKAVLLGIANDPKFKDGMAKQIKTLAGQWSNFRDQLDFTLAAIGGLLVQTFDLKGVINNIRSAMKAFSDWFAKLDPGMRKLIAYGAAAAAAFGPFLIVLGKMALGWSALIPVFGKTIVLIKAVGTAIKALVTGQAAAATAATGLAAALGPFLIGAAVIAGLVGIVALIKKFRNASKDAIKNYEKLAATQESKKNVDNLAQAYKKLTDKINNAKPNSKEWKELKKQQQELMNQIAKSYPSVVTAYDAMGNARKIDIGLLKKQLSLEKKLNEERLENAREQAKKAARSILNKATKDVDFIQSQIKELQGMTPGEWVNKYRLGIAKTTSSMTTKPEKFKQEAYELYKEQELMLNNQLKLQLKAQKKAQAQYDKVMGKKPKKTKNKYPFVCPICGEKFKTKAELKKHLKEIHGVGVDVLSVEDKRTPYQKAKEKWETARDVSDWAPEEALRQWNAMVGGKAVGKEIEDFKQKQGKLTKAKLEAELKAQNELALARLDGYDRQLEDLKQKEADELSESKIGEQRKKNIQDRYAIERNKVIAERDKQALVDQASANALQMELEAQTLEDQGKYTEAAITQEEAKWERTKATLTKGTDAYKLEYQKYLDTVATIQKNADEKLREAQIESQKSKIDDQIQGLEYQIEEAELLDDEAKSQKLVADLQKKINDQKIKRIDIDIAELRRQKDVEKNATKKLEIENQITDALREKIGLKKDNAVIDLQSKPILKTFAENWQKGLDETFKDWNDWATNIKSIAQQTAQSMQSAFSNGFLNVLKGNFDDLEDDVTNFLDSILRQITDMWSKTITQKVMKGGVGNWIGNLFNSAGGVAENAVETTGKTALNTATIAAATSMTTLGITSGTLSSTLGLLSAAAQTAAASLSSMGLSSTFAGGFAEGGYIPPGQWGIMGERGPEPIFAGKTGATILPKSSLNNGGGGGNVSINIINNAGNQVTARVTSKKTDSTGNQAITLVMDSISKNANGSRDFFRALGRS